MTFPPGTLGNLVLAQNLSIGFTESPLVDHPLTLTGAHVDDVESANLVVRNAQTRRVRGRLITEQDASARVLAVYLALVHGNDAQVRGPLRLSRDSTLERCGESTRSDRWLRSRTPNSDDHQQGYRLSHLASPK
jgi:hypothetical protein